MYGTGIEGCARSFRYRSPLRPWCFTIHFGIATKHRAARSEPIERLKLSRHCFFSHALNSDSQSPHASVTIA